MLRSLVNEMVKRRLWPIMLVAVLVILAAPLLFLKSAPDDAPAASDAPPPAKAGELPAGAERLVTDSDKAATPRDDASRPREDPFAPPASAAKAAQAGTAPANPTAGAAPSKSAAATTAAKDMVITNPDGSKTTVTTSKPGSGGKSTKTKPAPAPKATPPASSDTNFAAVTVRFAKSQKSKARRSIPRLESFKAGSAVAAIFVKYSPSRDKAVFAIAPTTRVSGDVKCRRVHGVCRYVDIPAGKYARLKVWTPDNKILSRRLDVVSIKPAGEVAASTAPAPASTPTRTTLGEAKCLVKFLLALPSILPSIPADTCQ